MSSGRPNWTLTREQDRAAAYQAQSSTVRLVDETDPSLGGSGVAIRLGGMFFVATAAHVLPQGHTIGIPPRRGETWAPVVRAEHRDKAVDVGVLELQSIDEPSIRDRFLTAERVLTHTTEWPTGSVVVAGYPRDYIFDVVDERLYGAGSFLSGILPHCEWPSQGGLERPLIAERDVLVRHEPETTEPFDDPPQTQVGLRPPGAGLPDVPGMSGGGIWLAVAIERSGLWYPSVYLVAIQVDRHRRQKWMRGTLIKHWLDLLGRNYPGLQGEIEAIMQNSIGGESKMPSGTETPGGDSCSSATGKA